MSAVRLLTRGSLLSASSKMFGKVIGFVSTLILARLLTPEDFGLIAAISIVLYFFDVFGNAATEQYVMQKRRLLSVDLQTAWTVNLLLKCLIFFVLLMLAPWIAELMRQPDITLGIAVSALVLPVMALKSPSLLQQKRHIRYEGLFWLALTEKLIAFGVVISTAVVLRNYWAFIFADLISSVAGVLLSYIWFYKRPRMSTIAWRKQLGFSSWMIARNIIGYLRSQIDTVFVSRHYPADTLGQYYLSRDLAMMPGHYLLAPAIEPVLSAFRETAKNDSYFLKQVASTILITFIFTLPIAFFVSAYGAKITAVVLGSQWAIAGQLFSILIWLLVYWGAVYVLELVFIATEKLRSLFIFDLIALGSVLIALTLALELYGGVEALATSRVLAGFITTGLIIVFIFRQRVGLLLEIFGGGTLVAIASVISVEQSVVMVDYFNSFARLTGVSGLIAELLFGGLAFAIVYISLLIVIIIFAKNTRIGAQIHSVAGKLMKVL
ncbi:MAG: oligosaccharide flippase family protein [Pseudomonadales bacterium]|nr:oligosaccharide flippase family protein [Pseudomonadales bacterium]